MATITKQELQDLESIRNVHCISIYMPTHQKGEEVLQQEDAKLLKNHLKEVKLKLEQEPLGKREISELIAPIQELIHDGEFWRHQSNGLALFLTNGIVKKYTLPISFKPFNHVANSLYLTPLLPMFTGDDSFFLLWLQLEKVKLYKKTRYYSSEIQIEDKIPSRMEERVGYDYEQKSLQFRSQQEGHGAAAFHGHGEADRDRKNEIERYFSALDRGLMTLIQNESKPLIIACQDYLFPIYQKVNTYKYLLADHISFDPTETDESKLRELAWKKLSPVFDKERLEKIEIFKKFDGTSRTSSDIEQIIPAAILGKIDSLFIQKNEDIWGIYEPEKDLVRVDKELLPSNVSLLNRAAMKTFLNGGKVYLLEKEDMPNPFSKINALYRY
ncbi:hypothetical protein H4O18_04965 [Arenibacter sp. BSSL-BM3]|uniref:Uncharacterized protein n=1 Tax=Arenibacter arenosicollis TaxID=2762274 RepID=A0ABR7QJH5_9FLAO|nr:hypothetical protein [Arenibacter arenosicollis]MBC8767336.1 hypothetical protein [Arenibacter arenosicollis]